MSVPTPRIPVVVIDVADVTPLVRRFTFRRPDASPLPAFSGGAHVVVEMDDHGTRRLNPYSLMSDAADRSAYAISVRRDEAGRGGSRYLHDHVRVGDRLHVGTPVNLFPADLRAKKHLMIAGGIGVTPFIAQMAQLSTLGAAYELHYAAQTAALMAYGDGLAMRHPGRVHRYLDDAGPKLALDVLLGTQPIGTHLYVCGPRGMIGWVLETARGLGWPEGALHSEAFLAPPVGLPFAVRLAASGIDLTVAPGQSLLEAIEAVGVQAPYLCRGGACGQCETAVLECDGAILHNDHWLTDDQRAGACTIMPCVSRFEGRVLVLDR